MFVDPATTPIPEVYALLVGLVAPRPIAWVTTVDPAGRVNLAPFSFFNAFGANPPVVVFSPTLRRNGSKKDTLLNVEAVGEFVLNAVVEPLAEAMNLTSKELPHGESEADLARLTLVPSVRVRPPRVAEAPAHLECRVLQIVPLGTGPIAGNLVIGEVVAMHVADELLDERKRIDPRRLRSVARLGGDWYARTSDLFELNRPQ